MKFRIILVCFILVPGWLVAQPLDTEEGLGGARNELAVLEKQIDTAGNTLQARRHVSELRKRLVTLRGQSRDCITDASTKVENLKARREALGEPSRGDDPAVAALRRELDTDSGRNEKRRVACEQIAQASQDLIERIQVREKEVLKARLFAHGLSTQKVIVNALDEPRAWSRLVAGFLDEGSGWERLTQSQHWIVLTVFVLLLAAGIAWRRRWFLRHGREDSSRYLVAASPWLLAVTGTCIMFMVYLPAWPPVLVTRLALGILTWLVINTLLLVWLAGRKLAGLADEDARSLTRWLRILSQGL